MLTNKQKAEILASVEILTAHVDPTDGIVHVTYAIVDAGRGILRQYGGPAITATVESTLALGASLAYKGNEND